LRAKLFENENHGDVVLQQYLLRQLPFASLSHRPSFDDALLPLNQLLLRHKLIKFLVSVLRSYCKQLFKRFGVCSSPDDSSLYRKKFCI